MFRATTVILLLSISAVNAGFWDDVQGKMSDVGDFFQKQFESVKDLFAKDQTELEKNINRVKDLLTGIKEKAQSLLPLASDAQKATIEKVDEYLQEVDEFQKKAVADGKEKFDENKAKWEQMVDDIFTKGGLKDVMNLLNVKQSTQISFCAAAILPVVMAFVH